MPSGSSKESSNEEINLVHLAIECQYRCSKCDDNGYYTFEFSKVGMYL